MKPIELRNQALKIPLSKTSGIYLIFNNGTGKGYIGQASSLYNRWHSHKSDLKLQKHGNEHLQRSFNKYGEESFEFHILTLASKEQLNDLEQYYLDKLDKDSKYNLCEVEPVKTRSEETRRKISEANKKRFQDPEARAKLGALRKGTKLSKEHKDQISTSLKGKAKPPRSKEHCQKLSQVVQTGEQKKKMSEAATKRWQRLKEDPKQLKEFLDYRNSQRGILT